MQVVTFSNIKPYLHHWLNSTKSYLFYVIGYDLPISCWGFFLHYFHEQDGPISLLFHHYLVLVPRLCLITSYISHSQGFTAVRLALCSFFWSSGISYIWLEIFVPVWYGIKWLGSYLSFLLSSSFPSPLLSSLSLSFFCWLLLRVIYFPLSFVLWNCKLLFLEILPFRFSLKVNASIKDMFCVCLFFLSWKVA